MDGKTRCSVQYVINLLVLDAIPLFKAVDLAMDRIRGIACLYFCLATEIGTG
jgi:hypothetical protein